MQFTSGFDDILLATINGLLCGSIKIQIAEASGFRTADGYRPPLKLDDRSASAEAKLVDGSGQVVARARAELRIRERDRDTR